MNFNNKKGFTLIELLVVIAIIGILSGLIIVSMSGAQNSAKDANIKAYVDQMRAAAQVFYANNSTYLNFDASGDGLILKNAMNAVGGTAGVVYTTGGTGYCISKELISNAAIHYCVDSAGTVKQSAATDCVALTCP
ncbi:MAG: type II secretion system protein [Candidatus Pacebacteria bacterium]|nr:type II secretion system protein [Candidatus Paceibacterota bacterium]